MYDPSKHVIELKDGQLDPSAITAAHVPGVVRAALESAAPSGIVVNFHGGLVSRESALAAAKDRLYGLYAERARAYPVFFVWQSGFWEAPTNNLGEVLEEISKTRLFREFTKTVAEWVLKRTPAAGVLKGTGGSTINEQDLRRQFDDWFAGRSASPPVALQFEPEASEESLRFATKDVPLNDAELLEQITEGLEGNPELRRAIEDAHNGDGGEDESLLSQDAADKLFGSVNDSTKGPFDWTRVAARVVTIVVHVIRRFGSGRSHGPYVTIVEEVLRSLYVDAIGRIGWWDRMKQDTEDAFKEGPQYGGTAFLTALASELANGARVPRITLVGHSTGAVYICNFLNAAARIAPGLGFDVIFEAPAATHDLLAETVAVHQSRIRNFRQFGMSDERERVDTIVPLIYTSSLLYFVSGILESEPDKPLVGMARYCLNTETYSATEFPSVEACRRFYSSYSGSLNWSRCSGPPGNCSDAHHHGDFDDGDTDTMDSVVHILTNGF